MKTRETRSMMIGISILLAKSIHSTGASLEPDHVGYHDACTIYAQETAVLHGETPYSNFTYTASRSPESSALSFISVHATEILMQTVPIGAIARIRNSDLDLDQSKDDFSPESRGVVFTSLPGEQHDVYLVGVTTSNEGYKPLEDNDLAGETANPDNTSYGNPRRITGVDSTRISFLFVDTYTITGRVQDKWTGQNIEYAKFVFKATSGNILDEEVRKYPHTAAWGDDWESQSDGEFPDQMYLPRVNYILTITNANYHDYITDTIMPTATGQTNNLGTLSMTPVDNNSNGIADQWEEAHGILASNIVGTEDLDGDGASNLDEYLADTDPNDPTSRFSVVDTAMTLNGFKLFWEPLAQGRNYTIQRADSIAGVPFWSTVAGPGASTSFLDGWTDTNSLDRTKSRYRVRLTVP